MKPKFPKPVKREKSRRPLTRKHPMRKRSPRRIAKESPAEKKWKLWVHSRPCAGIRSFHRHLLVCDSPLQQAHFRDHTGLGLKESNFKSIPLCRALHEDYDQTKGIFESYGPVGKKSWFLMQLICERADFALEHGCSPEDWTPSNQPRRTP